MLRRCIFAESNENKLFGPSDEQLILRRKWGLNELINTHKEILDQDTMTLQMKRHILIEGG